MSLTYTGRHRASSRPNKSKKIVQIAVGLSMTSAAVIGAAGQASAASSSSGSDILSKIRYCESSNNYKAQNPSSTASGAYQFLDTTWQGLGHSGRAKDASAAEQDAAARALYAQAGTSPWVSSQPCWGGMSTAPSTVVSNTGGTASANTATGGGSVSYPSSALTSTETLSPGIANFPYKRVALTKAEKALVASITEQQKQQSSWTIDARLGHTVPRTVTAASGLTVYTHSHADFTSAQTAILKPGDKVLGKYVNVDWFQITSGKHAGQFVSTATLTRLPDEKNGMLTPNQLAQVPDYLRASVSSQTSRYLNPTVLKQLVYMNAAYRSTFGTNLQVSEGYRTLSTQQAYTKNNAYMTANPGDSNHGLGEAIDFAGAGMRFTGASHQWMNKYASGFGFQNPKNVIVKGEYWHYDFTG